MNRSYASAATVKKLIGRGLYAARVLRRVGLIACAFVLLVFPSADASGTRVSLPLDQQVGQLVVLTFRGTTAPAYVLTALRKRHVAGVILFGGNISSPDQLRALTLSLREAGGSPLVAVDQEGGQVRRVPWVGPVRSEAEQVETGTVQSDAAAAAWALRALGVTVSLAPVADVPSVRDAAISSRAFSSDPTIASASVAAAVRGWLTGGVSPTAKHFPGLGGASGNTDRAVVTIRRSRSALERVDLAPFRAAIQAGVPLVMVGHARYPALDRSHIASQSSAVVDGLLREQLGFRGVVVTDSLEARASLATGSITTDAQRAIAAGADLVLLTGRGSYQPVYDHLLARAREDPVFRRRVRESSARVWRLKATS
jgi:beta-N-acetylhexosaminidase